MPTHMQLKAVHTVKPGAYLSRKGAYLDHLGPVGVGSREVGVGGPVPAGFDPGPEEKDEPVVVHPGAPVVCGG